MHQYHIQSVQDFAQPVNDLIQAGTQQLLLHGELGAGKTTFTTQRVKQLTGKDLIVQSPTYTYFHIYDETILHVDMWRIEEATQLQELGFYELLDQYTYSAIERPKRIDLYAIPENYAHVQITKNEDDSRTVTIR